jgi:hypothetical protein
MEGTEQALAFCTKKALSLQVIVIFGRCKAERLVREREVRGYLS